MTVGTESETGTPNDQAAVSLVDVTKTYHLGEPVHTLSAGSLDIEYGSYTAVMDPRNRTKQAGDSRTVVSNDER